MMGWLEEQSLVMRETGCIVCDLLDSVIVWDRGYRFLSWSYDLEDRAWLHLLAYRKPRLDFMLTWNELILSQHVFFFFGNSSNVNSDSVK